MRPATGVTLDERLQTLDLFIQEGLILEAMQRFCDPAVSMQDTDGPATAGLPANMQRVRRFLDGVQEWIRVDITSTAIGLDTTMSETVLDFITTEGRWRRVERVDVAQWHNGKIVQQRCYYDSASRASHRG